MRASLSRSCARLVYRLYYQFLHNGRCMDHVLHGPYHCNWASRNCIDDPQCSHSPCFRCLASASKKSLMELRMCCLWEFVCTVTSLANGCLEVRIRPS